MSDQDGALALLPPQALSEILKRWSGIGRSGLLPALIEAQEQGGWLPAETVAAIAKGLGVPQAEAFGVADFYSHLYTHPVGNKIVRVCDDVPCYLAGSEHICAAVQKQLGIAPGETTADAGFTFEIVPCLGRCEHAPVVIVGDHIHDDVTPEDVAGLLTDGRG